MDKDTLQFNSLNTNDSYTFSSGDGAVQIQDNGGDNTLQINADILNTVFYRNGDNLNICLNNSNDILTINNWFADTANQIETINSSDGYTLSNNQVQLLIENIASYTQSNNISWADAIQQDSVGVQSVLQQIWVKQ